MAKVLISDKMSPVSAEEAPHLKPYMRLAELLGSFIGQATKSAISEVTISFDGACDELNYKPLIGVVLQGLLAPTVVGVNMVNAPSIAKDRNITVREVRSDNAGAYQSLIPVEVTTENQVRSIGGTIFNDEPRVVQIKGIAIDAELGPNMLYVTNHDKPGLIGHLGTLLGDAGINIATFHLGRANQGGDAIALIEIDNAPSEELLAQVSALDHVVVVTGMKF